MAFFLSPVAAADIENIQDYTIAEWSEQQAHRYLSALFIRFRWLSDNPEIGLRRDDIKDGYRSFPEGKHIIFYRVMGNDIEVLGVVHQSADYVSHFSEYE